MSESTYIYCLRDPRTGEIRYVGASVNPASRLRQHLSPSSRRSKQKPLQDWLADLEGQGREPELVIVEEVSGRHALAYYSRTPEIVEAEKRWIVYLLDEGHRLTNQRLVWVRAEEDGRTIDAAIQRGRELFPDE